MVVPSKKAWYPFHRSLAFLCIMASRSGRQDQHHNQVKGRLCFSFDLFRSRGTPNPFLCVWLEQSTWSWTVQQVIIHLTPPRCIFHCLLEQSIDRSRCGIRCHAFERIIPPADEKRYQISSHRIVLPTLDILIHHDLDQAVLRVPR